MALQGERARSPLGQLRAVRCWRCPLPTAALPDDLRSPIRIEREELRNLHFFPPEYGRECPCQGAQGLQGAYASCGLGGHGASCSRRGCREM